MVVLPTRALAQIRRCEDRGADGKMLIDYVSGRDFLSQLSVPLSVVMSTQLHF